MLEFFLKEKLGWKCSDFSVELKDESQLQKTVWVLYYSARHSLAFDNVDQHTAASNLGTEPVYRTPPPSPNQTAVVWVTCKYSWLPPVPVLSQPGLLQSELKLNLLREAETVIPSPAPANIILLLATAAATPTVSKRKYPNCDSVPLVSWN